MKRVLVTGALGQIGTELVRELRARLGDDRVMATDLRATDQPATDLHATEQRGTDPDLSAGESGPYRSLDCTDGAAVARAVREFRADTIFHLAALLSAVGERRPLDAYRVNLGGVMHVLEVAREEGTAVFIPSSIAAFGPDTPRDPTPQDTIQRPTTMYGVTKVAGELLADYYHRRFGVDARGLRYPGLISHSAPPGGGTTDYAVEIFHEALDRGHYTCFLSEDTQLDMMYMPDAVRASLELMEADPERLRHRNAFNVTAMQLTPGCLAEALADRIDGFTISYEVDPVRQAIADSWPRRIDDSVARAEWGWSPGWDLNRMVDDMLRELRKARSGITPGAS